MPGKPDYIAFLPTDTQSAEWSAVGRAWVNFHPDGTEFISVTIDFLPVRPWSGGITLRPNPDVHPEISGKRKAP